MPAQVKPDFVRGASRHAWPGGVGSLPHFPCTARAGRHRAVPGRVARASCIAFPRTAQAGRRCAAPGHVARHPARCGGASSAASLPQASLAGAAYPGEAACKFGSHHLGRGGMPGETARRSDSQRMSARDRRGADLGSPERTGIGRPRDKGQPRTALPECQGKPSPISSGGRCAVPGRVASAACLTSPEPLRPEASRRAWPCGAGILPSMAALPAPPASPDGVGRGRMPRRCGMEVQPPWRVCGGWAWDRSRTARLPTRLGPATGQRHGGTFSGTGPRGGRAVRRPAWAGAARRPGPSASPGGRPRRGSGGPRRSGSRGRRRCRRPGLWP